MTLELTPTLEQRLQHLAVQVKRSPEQLAHEAMEQFLAEQECFLAAIKEGDDDFAHGDFLEHSEVVALFADVLNRR